MGDESQETVDRLLELQRKSWASGKCRSVEALIAAEASLADQDETLLDLIYSEFCLRLDLGEHPTLEEYCLRFPALTSRLIKLLEVHAAFEADSLDTQTVGVTDSGTVASMAPDIAVSGSLGHFRLIERIGVGRHGSVWKALDENLGRIAAVKLPRGDLYDPIVGAAFLREARLGSRLRHANIAEVYEVNECDGIPYIASRFIDGPNLRDWIEGRELVPTQAATLCACIAEAVQHAHDQGIIHRDIKPANIIIDSGETPHVTDFGLAKCFTDESSTATADGVIKGTPAYMSPEQIASPAMVGPSSDIYSVGVIFFELLTGRRPFDGEISLLLHRVMHEEPDLDFRSATAIPNGAQIICHKALARLPAGRYASAAEFADDLRRFARGEPVTARRLPALRSAMRWTRRNALSIGALTAAVGLAVPFVMEYSRYRGRFRNVQFETKPGMGVVTFIPLGEDDELPRIEEATEVRTNPLGRVRLKPGDYLVVAVIEGFGFQEVFRRVPTEGAGRPELARHRRWRNVGSGVEIPAITVFPDADFDSMPRIPAAPKFVMGLEGSKALSLHHRSVPAFKIDPAKVSVNQYKQWMDDLGTPMLPQRLARIGPPGQALRHVMWEDAVTYAEFHGKRLLDEAEFELAAANWGQPLGMLSGPPEWTVNKFSVYPSSSHPDRAIYLTGDLSKVVRGGDNEPEFFVPFINHRDDLIHRRYAINRRSAAQPVGFRCARSLAPRLRAADFVRLLAPASQA